MGLTLSEYFAFEYQLIASPDQQDVNLSPKGKQVLAKNHKLVLALAGISRYEETQFPQLGTEEAEGHFHQYRTAIPSKAAVKFLKYIQNGKTMTANVPMISGVGITEINWDFNVVNCTADAWVNILAFD
jgi:hypothetical protein